MPRTLAISLCAALLLVASHASAQLLPNAPPVPPTDTELALAQINDVAEVMRRAEEWKGKDDLRRYTYALERALQLRPYSPTFMYRLAEAYAKQGQKTKTYNLLLRVQKQGLALNPDPDKDFDPVRSTDVWKYIIDALKINAKAFGEGKPALTLKGAPELIESVAFDGKRKRFLVGSVRTGEILAVAMDGKTSAFASPQTTPALRSVFALAVDEARGFLWVGTAGAPQYVAHRPAEFGSAALLKFDLRNGKLLEAYPLQRGEKPRMFGAITVAANGTVYATDAIANLVYQARGGKLVPLFDVPGSTSLRGIAVSPDEKFLYFVDYELGLRVADLSKSEIRELAKEEQNFGGIDGLYWFDGQLLAVQNGSIPTRVIRIKLGKDRLSVDAVQPLEANKDELVMPTFGTLAGEDFYFLANSQRDVYGADGKPLSGTFPEERVLYKVSARYAWEAQAPAVPAAPKSGKR
ncbi:MAG: hypothetical protein OMOMHJEC_01455 [Xanthomonadales bacterium]|nr:hypothetical protein [Xanthomonadales bacterium]